MLQVHPVVRLLASISLLIAVFLAAGPDALALVYMLVFTVVVATKGLVNHLRFILFVGGPLLLALLLVWGVVIPMAPTEHTHGLLHTSVYWLRIISCAGILQALFLPLIERPQHLRGFLTAIHMNGEIGLLIITSILFIPEVKRRLTYIVDARKAQGYDVQGITGLRQLPFMLMPLVSSLLDSATKRAELWAHRGVLRHYEKQTNDEAYQPCATMLASLVAAAAICIDIII